MEKQPKVAIITINYNHSKETIECIDSILESEYHNYEIFLIDNASEVNDYDKLKILESNKKIHLLRSNINTGYVGGVNHGLSEAAKINPDYFLIMNNDTLLDRMAMIELVDTTIKYQNKAIVSGKCYNMDNRNSLNYIGQWCENKDEFKYISYVKDGDEEDIGQYDNELKMDMLDDIFWLLPYEIFKDIGYYSSYFFLYGEQNDYALRAVERGYKLIYTPKAKIWHYRHLATGNGNIYSLRVKYWQQYASLTLRYLHLNKLNFIRQYTVFCLKAYAKWFLSLIGILNNPLIRVNKSVAFHFSIWLIRKQKNKGFNPFDNI